MRENAKYLIGAASCLVPAVFLKLALRGYGFLSLCFAALAVLILCFMGLKLLSKNHEKAAKSLKTALICALALFSLAAAATEAVIAAGRIGAGAGEGEERYAVVLGAGVNGTVPSRSLRARLEAALKFAVDNPGATLILSGGQGAGEDISEARCMYGWLTAKGIAPSRLVMEDKSASTRENLIFSKEKLRELGAENEPVTVITAGYHIARAKLMADDIGISVSAARAAYTGYPVLELNYYLREIPAIWLYIITR